MYIDRRTRTRCSHSQFVRAGLDNALTFLRLGQIRQFEEREGFDQKRKGAGFPLQKRVVHRQKCLSDRDTQPRPHPFPSHRNPHFHIPIPDARFFLLLRLLLQTVVLFPVQRGSDLEAHRSHVFPLEEPHVRKLEEIRHLPAQIPGGKEKERDERSRHIRTPSGLRDELSAHMKFVDTSVFRLLVLLLLRVDRVLGTGRALAQCARTRAPVGSVNSGEGCVLSRKTSDSK